MRLIYSLAFSVFALPAWGACLNPAGIEGEMVYNASHKVMQYCDGASWYGMGWKSAPRTPADGPFGAIQFSNGSGVFLSDTGLFWDNANKRLGIGTSTPSSPLTVNGHTLFTNAFSATSGAISYRDNTDYLAIGPRSGSSANGAYISIAGAANTETIAGAGGIQIGVVGVSPAITIKGTTGNVGIGITNPTKKLHVAGGVHFSNPALFSVGTSPSTYNAWGQIDYANLPANDLDRQRPSYGTSVYRFNGHTGISMSAHSNYGGIRFYSQGYSGADPDAAYLASANAVLVASVNESAFRVHTDASKPGGGAWQALSDGRLKDIQAPYTSGLAQVAALKPVVYRYKAGNPRHEPSDRDFVGLVAQDVQPIFPEAISTEKDGYLKLDSTPISYAVINAIKELKAENEALRAEIEALKAAR